jgi:uncharacterized Zn-finger protein
MTEKLKALKAGGWQEFSGNKSPKCPHCGEDFSIRDNEAWHLYDDNNSHEVECPSCEHEFQVNSSATWYFSTDEQEDDDELVSAEGDA